MDNVVDIKRIQKIVKKYGTFKIEVGETMGELKITRCKVHFSRLTGDATSCEVDVLYKGTIENWGSMMGPVRAISLNERGYSRHWRSRISRNATFRRKTRVGITNHLKYFGVDIPYYHNLTIKKIVWVE